MRFVYSWPLLVDVLWIFNSMEVDLWWFSSLSLGVLHEACLVDLCVLCCGFG